MFRQKQNANLLEAIFSPIWLNVDQDRGCRIRTLTKQAVEIKIKRFTHFTWLHKPLQDRRTPECMWGFIYMKWLLYSYVCETPRWVHREEALYGITLVWRLIRTSTCSRCWWCCPCVSWWCTWLGPAFLLGTCFRKVRRTSARARRRTVMLARTRDAPGRAVTTTSWIFKLVCGILILTSEALRRLYGRLCHSCSFIKNLLSNMF